MLINIVTFSDTYPTSFSYYKYTKIALHNLMAGRFHVERFKRNCGKFGISVTSVSKIDIRRREDLKRARGCDEQLLAGSRNDARKYHVD